MMKKRVLALLLVVLALTCQMTAGAVNVETDRGDIQLTIQNAKGEAVHNVKVTLYKVGTARTENHNLYFDAVEAIGSIKLDGLNAQQNQEIAAAMLETIEELEDGAVMSWEATTNKDGVVRFEDLELGVYLAAQSNLSTKYLDFAPFLVYLPATSADGTEWEYEIQAVPKVEARPSGGGDPEVPEEPTPLPDPEIPLDPGEPEIVIPEPEVPTTLPQTGMLMWPIPLMAMAGLVLFAAGWSLEKKARKS